MNRGWLMTFLMMLVLTPPSNAAPETGAPAEVRKVLDDQVAAWNRGDLEAFMKGYWNSPNLRFYSKNGVISGWEATMARYRKEYQSGGHEMGQLSFSDLELNPVAVDSAWARGHWKVV